MLFVARAFYPSEDAESGTGLIWVFCILGTAALGLFSYLFAEAARVRWSWADAAVAILMLLVGASTARAAERRVAITMAWEWAGMGVLYFLARNLPRTRAESSALAGSIVATAVAVAAYGLFQVGVEVAEVRRIFERNPVEILAKMGIDPGSTGADSFRNRLYSNEPYSTFALPNSLAGFLVGPLVLAFALAIENLRRDGQRPRASAFAMAALPALVLLACLILTKSRSAVGALGLALAVLAVRGWRVIPRRVLLGSVLGLAVLVGGLVAAGVATSQLDIQILSEATKSLRYRWEYWVGAWGVITDASSPYVSTGLAALPTGPDPVGPDRGGRAFWSGVGPNNFAGPYLRHKLPQASEEIQDPHNLLLEVWASSGLVAMLALVAALAIGTFEALGPRRIESAEVREPADSDPDHAPPRSSAWIVGMAGLGWIAVWVLGKLNPMTQADLLSRWVVLGGSWALAILLGSGLWRRREVPGAGLGVAALALAVNLLAAGGIGYPSVAMMLWMTLALGMNLREDRACGRVRIAPGGLGVPVALAIAWAMLAGSFYGAVVPFWKSEAYLARGNAEASSTRPDYNRARELYTAAIEVDHYNVKPWLALADLEYAYWRSPAIAKRKEPRWARVLVALDDALDPQWRNPDSLPVRRRQAAFARRILADLPEDAKPFEILQLKATMVKAARRAASVYPTSATLRAELAQASADIGMYPDAVLEADQALKLDGLTPHLDKKLSPAGRSYLAARIPEWRAKADEPPPKAPLPPTGGRR